MRRQGVKNSIATDNVSPLDPAIVARDVLLKKGRRIGRFVIGCRLLIHEFNCYENFVIVFSSLTCTELAAMSSMKTKDKDNKFALLWRESQLCLPYE